MKNTHDVIQHLIEAGRKEGLVDTNQISDGYHTFGELYEHRIALFRALCSMQLEIDSEHGAPKWDGHTSADVLQRLKGFA